MRFASLVTRRRDALLPLPHVYCSHLLLLLDDGDDAVVALPRRAAHLLKDLAAAPEVGAEVAQVPGEVGLQEESWERDGREGEGR